MKTIYDTTLSRSAANWFIPSKLVKSQGQSSTLSLETNEMQKVSMVWRARTKEEIPAARAIGKATAHIAIHIAITRMPVLQKATRKRTRSPSIIGTTMQRTILRRNADRISRKSRRREPQGRSKALRATPITLVTVKRDTISKVDASESEIARKENA